MSEESKPAVDTAMEPPAEAIQPAAEPTPTPPPAPEPVAQPPKFELPDDVIERIVSRVQAGLQVQPQPAQQPQQPEAAEDAEFDKIWYTNPRAAAEKIRKDTLAQAAAERQKERGREEFWRAFEKDNPGVPQDIAEFVLQQNIQQLGPLPPDKARKELGEIVRKKLLDAVVGFRTTIGTEAVPTFEGGGGVPPQAKTPKPAEKDDEEYSGTAYLRRRRAARRKTPPKE